MGADDNAVMAYSDRLPVVLAGATNNGSVGIGLYKGHIYIYVPGITDAAGFRAALAANPLKIWYKSTAYTASTDLHIDKITRRWKMLELDGSEAWRGPYDTDVYPFFRLALDASCGGSEMSGRSTHFPVVPISVNTNTQGVGGWRDELYLRWSEKFSTVSDLTTWLVAQKAAGTPVRVLYQLETPEVYAADPHTLPALGSLPETVKASGRSTVEYSADTKHYIQSAVTQAVAAAVSLTGGTT